MSNNATTDKVKGTAKEAVGKITNDKEKEAEGFMEKTKGKIKDTADKAKDVADDAKDAVKEKLDK